MSHLILVDPWGFPLRPKEIAPRRNIPWYVRCLFQVFRHFNPLAALRLSGPFGLNAIKRMRPDLINKFEELFDSEEDKTSVVPNYMFHCNAQKPT